MFRRHVEVKVVKNKKGDKDLDTTSVATVEDYARIVNETGKNAVVAAGALIVTYVLSDIIRQATVAILKAKL